MTGFEWKCFVCVYEVAFITRGLREKSWIKMYQGEYPYTVQRSELFNQEEQEG